MSEVREAVRSRYANAAKQIAVINAPGSFPAAGCCQADGQTADAAVRTRAMS